MNRQVHQAPERINREFIAPNDITFLENLRNVQCGKNSSLKDAISEVNEFIIEQQQNNFGGQRNYLICHLIIASEEDTDSRINDSDWQRLINSFYQSMNGQKYKLVFLGLDQSSTQLEYIAQRFQQQEAQLGEHEKKQEFEKNTIYFNSKSQALQEPLNEIQRKIQSIRYAGQGENGDQYEKIPLLQRHKIIMLFTLDASAKMKEKDRWSKVCDALEQIIRNLSPIDKILGTIFNEETSQVTAQHVTEWNKSIKKHYKYKIDTNIWRGAVCQIF